MAGKLFIDLETYSSVDLRKSNVYRYSQAEDFEILMAAYATEDDARAGEVHVAIGREQIDAIPGLWDDSVTIVAHNAAFERVCLSAHRGMGPGEYLDPRRFRDTQALAGEAGYPQRLEDLAISLGAEEKDSAGTRLINLFSKPKRGGGRNTEADKPTEWAQFVEYCRQDVATLIDIERRLPDWPSQTEHDMWVLDQEINDQGIYVEAVMARAAIAAAEDNQRAQRQEIKELTGVDNPNSIVQLGAWLESQGIDALDLKKATVEELLTKELDPVVRRVLELRLELALVASKKYIAALDRINEDSRIRGCFQFFGAHTGRWAGRGVQLQNLPSASLGSELETNTAIADLMLGHGADAYTLKALVRGLFVGPFTVVDFSAIEARVIAWLAGEEWSLEAFRAGRDIYVETAARMFGVDGQGAKDRRKEGKVATLALGYGGGVNSLLAMGAEGDHDELQHLVSLWRDANKNIVRLWTQLDRAFRTGGTIGDHLEVLTDGSDRLLCLPSGRAVCYRQVGYRKARKFGRDVKELTYANPRRAGARIPTYGGKLAENITQAVARDVLAESMLALDRQGYRIVGHVHDEVIIEGEHDVRQVESLMTTSPDWATGLPLAAEGFTSFRYRKD